MLIVIGRIKSTDGKKIEACRIIDTKTKEVKLVSFANIKKALCQGEKIKGFKRIESVNYVSGHIKVNITKEKGKFTFNKLPELNGIGELVNAEDSNKLILYGWKGFAEAKKYHLFNYKGEEVVLDIKQFEEKVRAGEVNGAIINTVTGKPIISADLNIELS